MPVKTQEKDIFNLNLIILSFHASAIYIYIYVQTIIIQLHNINNLKC